MAEPTHLKSPSTFSRLRAIGLMASAKAVTRRKLEEKSVLRLFEVGKSIWNHEDKNVVIIQSGQCRLQIVAESGQATTLAFLTEGAVVGLIEQTTLKSVVSSFVATSNVSAVIIPSDVLQAAIEADADLSKAVIDYLANEASTMRQRLFEMATLSVQARVAAYLVEAANGLNSQQAIRAPQTHEEIASVVGTSREAVTRTLRNLVKHEVISYSRDNLRILNLLELKSLAKGG